MTNNGYSPGLRGVVAAETQLSGVDGEAGELIIRGYRVEEFASKATFEETIQLMWHGHLPNQSELARFTAMLSAWRNLPKITLDVLREAASQKISPMDALRMAVGTLDLRSLSDPAHENEDRNAVAIVGRMPTIVAAYWRLYNGQDPIASRAELSTAANYLYMLNGEEPNADRVRALDTYLNTVVDHGLNASTFAARVIMATGSDVISAVVGAIGALKGPLHGGAPGPALDMVFEIGDEAGAEPWLRKHLSNGELLMGFGHRIYKVRDPRAEVLAPAAEELFKKAGDMRLYNLAQFVEEKALQLIEEYKPGRSIKTNVEFFTALLLHGLELPTDLFAPTFAISRAVGWIAHCNEQKALGQIIRPSSVYVGPKGLKWKPAEII